MSVIDEVLNSSGYEDYQVEIGYLGIVAQVCAMFGMITAGKWLDLTKAYPGIKNIYVAYECNIYLRTEIAYM